MPENPVRFVPKTAFALIAGVLIILTLGCAGSLYKVRSPLRSPVPAGAASAEGKSLAINAVAMTEDEFSQDMFEANFPLSGVLPVRVELINKGATEIPLNKTRLVLRDTGGGDWKALNNKQTASAVMKANGVSIYTPASRKQFREDLSGHILDLATPLGPNEHRTGLLFFKSPKQRPVESPTGLTLSLKNSADSVEVKLN